MTEAEVPYLRRVLATNPGPMTLEGTNTWIVGDPAGAAPIVIDPGPLDEDHLTRVLVACGGRVATIGLTHRHPDHSAGAARLAELARCGVRAADPAYAIGEPVLIPGDVLTASGAELRTYATPGHTSDSVSLLLTGADGVVRLLTGDTILGRGTSVIAKPDGDLGYYLTSLDRLERLVLDRNVTELLPGHGPVVQDPAGWLAFYRTHRHDRLAQVRAALAAGDRTPAEVVARVYAEVDRALWPAAEQSVAAQLAYLARTP